MSLSDLVADTIEETNNSLISDVKNYDRNAMNELIAYVRIECFAEYSSDEIESEIKDQLSIKSDKELGNNSDKKYFRGCPIVDKNGYRLAFQNPRNNIIHICRTDDSAREEKVHKWSECGNGSFTGKTKDKSIYIDDEDVSRGYVIRDGDIIGKICGNCENLY